MDNENNVLDFVSFKKEKTTQKQLSQFSKIFSSSDLFLRDLARSIDSQGLYEVKSNDIAQVDVARKVKETLTMLIDRLQLMEESIEIIPSSAEIIQFSKKKKKKEVA